jgi:hypothetical protein
MARTGGANVVLQKWNAFSRFLDMFPTIAYPYPERIPTFCDHFAQL